MRISVLVLGLAVSASLLAAPLSASAAAPVAATCGAVLTHDAYLPGDLTCSGDGVTLAADVRFDLRGHRLIGSGKGTAVTLGGPYSPTLQNGSLEHWNVGIEGQSPDDDSYDVPDQTFTISAVTFAHDGQGIDAAFSANPGSTFQTNFSIKGSTFDHNRRAMGGVFTGHADITASVFTHNTSALSFDTGGVSITDSRFEHNNEVLSCTEAGCLMRNSTLTDNTYGVGVSYSDVELVGNSISGSNVAVSAYVTPDITLTHNRLYDNKIGVSLEASVGTLTGNWFVADGVGYSATEGTFGTTKLVGNYFVRNRDGIHTTEQGVRLRANRAFYNTRYGIYAPSADDAGANRAHGNGTSPQCTGVVCTS